MKFYISDLHIGHKTCIFIKKYYDWMKAFEIASEDGAVDFH